MKRICLLLLIAFDILQQLNVPHSDATPEIVNAIAYGNVGYSRVATAFKAAAPAMRAAMVEQVLTWTKAYISSPQFAKDYAAFRDQQKPQAPQYDKSVDDEIKATKAKQLADFEESKKAIASLPPEQRKAMEDALKHATNMLKAQDTPEARKMQHDMLQAQRDDDEKTYEKSRADHEKKYPVNARDLVRQRLREFLAATSDVDYSAKLTPDKLFVNPAYESKPGEWKLAYRAGKETTDQARAFATAWLAELK